jgi:hypothetical protein
LASMTWPPCRIMSYCCARETLVQNKILTTNAAKEHRLPKLIYSPPELARDHINE